MLQHHIDAIACNQQSGTYLCQFGGALCADATRPQQRGGAAISSTHHGQCCSNGIAEPHSWLDSSSLVVGIAIVATLLPDTSCSLHDSPVVVPLLDIPMVYTAMLGSVVAAAVADTCPMALLGSDPTCGVVVVVVAGVVGIVLEEVEAEPIQE
jgi:hypothetical protein